MTLDTDPVKFHVEATGITHRLSLCISPPQRGCAGVTVSATQACPSGGSLLQKHNKSSCNPQHGNILKANKERDRSKGNLTPDRNG